MGCFYIVCFLQANKLIKKQFGIKRLMLLAKVLTLNTSNKTENFGNNGKIEIEYYSDDELERMFDMIMSLGKEV